MTFDYQLMLTTLANWAAILTAVIATVAYGKYLYDRHAMTKKLSNFLRKAKIKDPGTSKKTPLYLSAELGMTEAEIFASAFRTKKVTTALSYDEKGRAKLLLFEYCGNDVQVPEGS